MDYELHSPLNVHYVSSGNSISELLIVNIHHFPELHFHTVEMTRRIVRNTILLKIIPGNSFLNTCVM